MLSSLIIDANVGSDIIEETFSIEVCYWCDGFRI